MTENSDSGTTPPFLSSLPDQPITDDMVKQIGESDHPKIRGAMGFPGSTPGTIEAFLLKIDPATPTTLPATYSNRPTQTSS